MSKQEIRTDQAPTPIGAYSQGIVSGGFLYTAGFGPQDPETGEIAPTVGEQTTQVLRNVQAVLTEAGLTFDDVVKVTVHLQNLKGDFAEYDAVYREFFDAPYPVRTTVGSELMNILVEIDVVARLRD